MRPVRCAVTLDVIEHLGDPASVLTELRGAMREGGRSRLTTDDSGALCAPYGPPLAAHDLSISGFSHPIP
ncbi:MAG TPA: hypothetical protein VG963_24565 [Polyangiaceae bacterium]|nr:hypothetical protein [Polyangiaceae bacterium]